MADSSLKASPAVNGTVDLKLYDVGGGLVSFHPPVGYDSDGDPLPAGFDTYAKAVTQTWDESTGLPLIRTEVVTVGANTYTRTTTNTLTGSDITGTTVSRWVKA